MQITPGINFAPGFSVGVPVVVPPPGPTSTTSLLMSFDNNYLDQSPNAFSVTTTGNPSFSTTSRFGTHALSFPGTNSTVRVPASESMVLDGDFTLECWIRFGSLTQNAYIMLSGTNAPLDGGNGWAFYIQSTQGLRLSGPSFVTTVSQGNKNGWNLNQYYHVACTRQGDTVRLYRDGVELASGVFTLTLGVPTRETIIGSEPYSPWNLNAILDELRVIKGEALYTTNFTPPEAPFSA